MRHFKRDTFIVALITNLTCEDINNWELVLNDKREAERKEGKMKHTNTQYDTSRQRQPRKPDFYSNCLILTENRQQLLIYFYLNDAND